MALRAGAYTRQPRVRQRERGPTLKLLSPSVRAEILAFTLKPHFHFKISPTTNSCSLVYFYTVAISGATTHDWLCIKICLKMSASIQSVGVLNFVI